MRRVRPAGWWFDALLVGGFVLLTLVLWHGWLLGVDTAVRDWCDGHRPSVLHSAALGGNLLGQGTPLTVICLGSAAVRGWRQRQWWPVLLVVAAFCLTFFTIGPLKVLTDRAGPHAQVPHPERFGSGGLEYPSGHLGNSIVWYGVLVVLLSPWLPLVWRRVIRVLPPAVLSVTTVYLGFHWLTDTIAGIALGLFFDRVLHRVAWEDLRRPRWLGGHTPRTHHPENVAP